MPNRHVILSADAHTASSSDGHYLGRVLCPRCMCSHPVAAEAGCSTDACDDCGSPSDSE